ncbi:DUF6895 family protein [Lapillicoccus sp.]|uniref:DUF6895 family protein n=1 Tax=Lapillicoccus sp. TaxID=1909287 RepID=UPI00326536C0
MSASSVLDLTSRVHGALRIAAAAVDAATGPEPPALPDLPGIGPLVASKVLGETCLLLRAAHRAAVLGDDAVLRAAVSALARTVAPHVRSTDLLASLCVRPDTALDEGFGHLHLRDLGLPDPTVDDLLDRVVPAEGHPGLERTPTRALEQLWLRFLWTGAAPSTLPVETALLASSVIGRPLDPVTCSLLELYSFTHIVMYASDSGRRVTTLPRPVDNVLADAETALAVALDSGNLDLAAEALWTWPMLGATPSAIARFAWRLLAAAQDETGLVVGPQFSTETHAALGSESGEAYLLATSYHSSIVMGILCACTLAAEADREADRPSPGEDDAPRAQTVAALRLLVEAVAGQPVGRWLRAFDRLGPSSQAELAPLLLRIALRRAAERDDVAAVRRALELAVEHDLLDNPVVPHAAAFLRSRVGLAHALEQRRADQPGDTSAASAAAAAARATQLGAVP